MVASIDRNSKKAGIFLPATILVRVCNRITFAIGLVF